ncbi:MAG: hypothetical protein K9L68_06650 [Spirochaetales bacterium]|nr:hypothetical protein [Spirochaetales bacterium]MCF7938263.1 hypothetical protein [Spirochaetales bacterium]
MKKENVLVISLLFLVSTLLPAERQLTLGESTGRWSHISRAENIDFVSGRRGTSDARLRENEFFFTGRSELLLHFNTTPPGSAAAGSAAEQIGPYTVSAAADAELSRNSFVFGRAAGAFFQEREGIHLQPQAGALFAPGSRWEDFTLQFWMNPLLLEDGEVLFHWYAPGTAEQSAQEFRISIYQRSIRVLIRGIFQDTEGNPVSIEMDSRMPMVPETWYHHTLRFDSTTGLIELMQNGDTAAISYANPTAETRYPRETGRVYLPHVEEREEASLRIGSSYTGLIDELHMSRDFQKPSLLSYAGEGIMESSIIDFGYTGSELLGIEAEYSTPGATGIQFFYRISDRREDLTSYRTDFESQENWKAFEPGGFNDSPASLEPAAGRQGRFLQFRVALLPDGEGLVSPSLHSMKILYEPDLPPSPPLRVNGEAMNAAVRISWSRVLTPDVAGYRIYYGTEPGRYRWSIEVPAEGGDAPMQSYIVGSGSDRRLENGRLYYFSVTTYDDAEPAHEGDFSREIAVRPSSVLERP